jgi:pimeloyl-ACP methyl ester carboxylesterase
MLDSAHSTGHRLILPNRRLFPGSTPYTAEEAKAFDASNSTEGLVTAFTKQGEYLLLFIAGVIQEFGLKSVVLGGWSLGTAFLSAVVAAIDDVDPDVRKRVAESVKAIVWWGASY